MPALNILYSSVVFNFDVGEECGVTQVGLSTRTNIISVVRLVASSASSSTRLIWMLKTAGKHLDYKYKTAKQKIYI